MNVLVFLRFFRLKYSYEYSKIIAVDISVFECIKLFWSQPAGPDITHITSCKNVISIEHTDCAVLVAESG